MVGWIQMIFGIQRYNEEMQVKFEYGCGPIIIGEVIALALRKCIENDSFHSYFRFSIYVMQHAYHVHYHDFDAFFGVYG